MEETSDDRPPAVPPLSPLGKVSAGYGEIFIRSWIHSDGKSEVSIGTPKGLPLAYWIVSAEHLMRAVAQQSNLTFKSAMDLLVEGATDEGMESIVIE